MIPKSFNYRNCLISNIALLHYFNDDLLALGANIATLNELKDLPEIMGVDEPFPFDIALLEASDDKSVKTIFVMIKRVDEVIQSIININILGDVDLNEVEVDFFCLEDAMDLKSAQTPGIEFWTEVGHIYIHCALNSLYYLVSCLLEHRDDLDEEELCWAILEPNWEDKFKDGDHNVQLLVQLMQKLYDDSGRLMELS